MNPAPVLDIKGLVHRCTVRTVPAQTARSLERDPVTRQITQYPREAHEGYDVIDVTLLTEDGGFALVGIQPNALEVGFQGVVPNRGEVTWPVRCFVGWAGPEGQRYRVVGYSVAGDVLAEREGRTAPVREPSKAS